MKINSTSFLFLNTMMLGVMVSLSSNNWMMIWSGMEISMMSFIPLISTKMILSNESSMKYFIVQSISSSIMMLGVMMMMMSLNEVYKSILVISLIIKTGMFPFQNWVLTIVEGMSYEALFLLFSVLKIPPITVLSYVNPNLEMFSLINLLMGGILGLNQTSIRKMMAYSSVFNMAFMLAATKSLSVWFSYFLIYSFMLYMILYSLAKLNVNFINQIIINEFNMNSKIQLWINMLSLGGMPPMLGFLSKMLVLQLMINSNEMILAIIMVFSSLLITFFYIRLTYLSMMVYSVCMKWYKLTSKLSLNIMTMNLFMMMVFVLMKPLT
uniref:NADH dehydrogenase subunit 2 n=1 Tax=Planaphrodes sahlbergii TaxID=3112131 RepID=UPI002E7A13FC|nr:NADH dehydrogenase subunit 2 [Planaphrodes sahlbergii]WRK21258.1 NADH dehydrogenase subunit 2 [Planaphrodes sahlbergii]